MNDKPLIKICGIRDVKTAVAAVGYGANYIGLVFYAASPRNLTLEDAKVIAQATKAFGGVPVAVFFDQDANAMQSICDALQINCIQLHGEKAKHEQHLLSHNLQRIYAVTLPKHAVTQDYFRDHDDQFAQAKLIRDRDVILFDHGKPGSGVTFHWPSFNYQGKYRFGIAGGLNAHNVTQALTLFQPHLIDISSGVEITLGEKSFPLIKQFIDTVYVYRGELC